MDDDPTLGFIGRYQIRHQTKGDIWDNMQNSVEDSFSALLTEYRYCGIVTFVSDCWEGEYMHLFHASACRGTLRDCDEGELAWIPEAQFAALPQWEGDRIFLRLMREHAPFFSLKLRYEGDRLAETVLNGRPMD